MSNVTYLFSFDHIKSQTNAHRTAYVQLYADNALNIYPVTDVIRDNSVLSTFCEFWPNCTSFGSYMKKLFPLDIISISNPKCKPEDVTDKLLDKVQEKYPGHRLAYMPF